MRAAGSSVLSTVASPPGGNSCLSTVDAEPGRVLTPRERIDRVNTQRKARGWSHEKLCREAGIQLRNWYDLVAERHEPKMATVAKAERAIRDADPPPSPSVIVGAYRFAVTRLARAHGMKMEVFDAQDLTVQKPRNANWLLASHINRMAIFILTVELEIKNADVARALGCTRSNVHAARSAVFDMCEQSKRTQKRMAKVAMEIAGRAE